MNKICFFNTGSVHYRTAIYKQLSKELEVDFYFGDKRPDNIKKVDYNLLPTYRGELSNRIIKGKVYWQSGALSLLSKDYEIYLVHADISCVSNWVFAVLCRLRGKKIYLWGHGWYGNESRIKRFVKTTFTNLANGIFLYGEYAKKLMIERGFKEPKLHVIYNSLDYDTQKEILKSITPNPQLYHKKFNNDNKNLIFIGRLTKVKSLHMILEAISLLQKEGMLYNITFIGDGEIRNELEKLASTLNISDKVWFYGACYDETEIATLISSADLCVSPGNVGLTAMHSLVYGTPVITHDNFPMQMPEFEAIEKDITGDFFEYQSVVSLVQIIRNWFLYHSDRERVRNECYNIINTKYNAYSQVEIFKRKLML